MSRRIIALAALISAAALAACTTEADNKAAPSAQAQIQTGATCASEISEFNDIIDSDHTTGNVAARVYAKMKPEVARADAACRAGHGAEAVRMLAATKARYGYR